MVGSAGTNALARLPTARAEITEMGNRPDMVMVGMVQQCCRRGGTPRPSRKERLDSLNNKHQRLDADSALPKPHSTTRKLQWPVFLRA
jgi:hypothetical protein